MHSQVGWAFIDKVTPSLTNMRELAPQKSVIPIVLVIKPIAAEYAEEYIIVESMDSRVRHVVSSLGCWGRQSWLSSE